MSPRPYGAAGAFLFMKKPSTALILKAYEKYGSISQVSISLKIDDSEVFAALAEAPAAFKTALAEARTLDAFIEGIRHLRKRFKTMRAPSTSAAVRDLGKLLVEFQAKKPSGADGGLGLSAEEEKRLQETADELAGNNDDSNDPEADDPSPSA